MLIFGILGGVVLFYLLSIVAIAAFLAWDEERKLPVGEEGWPYLIPRRIVTRIQHGFLSYYLFPLQLASFLLREGDEP